MTGGYSSRGGAGGVYANVDDLRLTAKKLGIAASDLGRLAGQSRANATSGALLRTAIFSPGTAASAEAHLIEASVSAHLVVVQLGAESLYLVAKADLFVLADQTKDHIRRVAQDLLVVPMIAIGVTLVVLDGEVRLLLGELNILAGVVTGKIPPNQIPQRLKELQGKVLDGVYQDASRVVSAVPDVVDTVTGGLPTALNRNPLTMLLPDDIEGLIGVAQGVAQLGGYGQDGKVYATPDGTRRTGKQSLSSVLSGVASIDNDEHHSGVKITKVDGDPPRWIVEIPGTSQWNPKAGGNPSDLTQNAELMQGRGALLQGIRDAMVQAGIQPTDDVMLAGHSQGGIAAAALAADTKGKPPFHVTNVLTAGSPVGHFDIPANVHVLSLEHRQDPVPRLEGDPNPDRANWQTLTWDVGSKDKIFDAHSGKLYAESAASIDMRDVDNSFDQFLGREGTEQRYDLSREPSVPETAEMA